MHSVCPVDQAQMDFFGVSSVSATDDRESIDRQDAANAKETSAHPSERVDPDTRKPQLALGLPSHPLNEYAWSEQECCAFLDAMLMDQLRLLADERTTAELRADLIAWIAAPKRNLEALKLAPFSFQACCAAAGVDFEEMRERTLAMFAPELIDQLD
jgi:hypothetical protein